MDIPYKFGDIIVRCYSNNFNAICICLDNIYPGHILYLGDTFNDHGGLSQFDTYGMGMEENRFHYRFITYFEIINLLESLNTCRKIRGNVAINRPIQSLDNVIKIVNNYKINMRKSKLIKLNEITN